MNWMEDIFWKSAYIELLDIIHDADAVFVPSDLVAMSNRFYPYQYSYCFGTDRRLAVMAHKDMMHKLNPALLDMDVYYDNSVFIILTNADVRSSLAVQLRADEIRKEIEVYKSSDFMAAKPWKVRRGSDSSKRILIVGAGGLGNTGDNLIADAISSVCLDVFGDANIFCSSFEVSEADIRDVDLVVIGGGGIVYGTEHAKDARQNLANYFFIPYLCKAHNIPCIVTSVGLQDSHTQLHDEVTNMFLSESFSSCASVSCRDSISFEYLTKFVPSEMLFLAPDVAFYLGLNRYKYRLNIEFGSSICFVGEIFDPSVNFIDRMFSDRAWVRSVFKGFGFTYVLMSNDDVHHAQRFAQLMQDLGWLDFSVVDTREWDSERLIEFFAQQRCVLSARFHGVIFSILADTPVINISDTRNIKKQTLVTGFFPEMKVLHHRVNLLDVRGVFESVCNDPSLYRMPEDRVKSVLSDAKHYKDQLIPFASEV